MASSSSSNSGSLPPSPHDVPLFPAPVNSSSSSGPSLPLPRVPPSFSGPGPAPASQASSDSSAAITSAARESRAYREKTKAPKFDSVDPILWLRAIRNYLQSQGLLKEILT